MGGLYSRRLRYGIGAIGLVFALLVCLRLIFVLGFSGVGLQEAALLETLGIGLRFDLRLAVLMLLPLALLAGWLLALRQRAACRARLFRCTKWSAS